MADPFAQLGISRRPANVLFGTPDVSAGALGGWSDAAVQSAAEDQAAQEEYQAAQDKRAAQEDARAEAARKRVAEDKVDQLQQMPELSARQKFLETEGPAMAASPRYNEVLRHQQQFEPSYADKTLSKSIALNIKDPEERQVFLDHVAKGVGTLAAKDEADRFSLKRAAAARLTAEADKHPKEAARIIEEEGYTPDIINYHVAQSGRGKDPEVNRLQTLYKNAAEMVSHSAKQDPTGMGKADPRLVERMVQHGDALDAYLTSKAKPTVTAPAVAAAAPAATPADGRNVFDRMNGVSAAPKASPGLTTSEGHPLNTVEEVKQAQQKARQAIIENPASSGDALAKVIAHPNTPLEEKNAALEKLRVQAANPTLAPGTTLGEAIERKERNKKLLADAEKEIALHPAREKFRKAWQAEKNSLDQDITDFSKTYGVPKQQVVNSLVRDAKTKEPEIITTVGPAGQVQQNTVQELLAQYIAQKEGQPATYDTFGQYARNLYPFAEHPAARELGVDGFLGAPLSRMLGVKTGVPTRRDVLEKYIDEAQAGNVAPAAAPLKIKSITPLN